MLQTREELALIIYESLVKRENDLGKQFKSSSNSIGYFVLDNLLPNTIATSIFENFPNVTETILKKNIREHKHIAYEMEKYNQLLEEIIYAFQNDKVVRKIAEICNMEELFPDEDLYAGGLSLMKYGNFLNPHLDNSHDKEVEKTRALNLLYYVTPNWSLENGGNLELWNNGLENDPMTIVSKFNRLVVMATHKDSWHSVNKVMTNQTRCCVSNYYYCYSSELDFHVTTFRARPGEHIKNFFLKADSSIRETIRKVFKKGIRENPHQYQKKKPTQ